ncbi:hypothetical protein MPTK2_1g12600 [Marchantia polymorpha subsp. ruderalis]
MGCARHPYEGTVGVCASCVSDRLNKETPTSDRGRFAKSSSLSEDYFLWKEGASTSSSISRHGLTKGGRIVDTIASLIKTDYAIPTNYEGPRGRDRAHHRDREHSIRSIASVEQRVFEASRKATKALAMPALDNEDGDARRFDMSDAAKPTSMSMSMEQRKASASSSREICEISAAEPPPAEREPGQTIHSLMDAEPKSGKFSRSTSKGSPASYFSRSGSKRQSWTVFWKSEKKDDYGAAGARPGAGAGEGLRSVSDAHERASSRPVFNSVDMCDFRSRRYSESSSRSHHQLGGGRSSRRDDVSFSTLVSVEEGCKRLADYDIVDRDRDRVRDKDRADWRSEQQQRKTSAAAAAASHSYERNRSWEQLGLAKLPFASVYAAPTSSNHVHHHHHHGSGRNLWKIGKKKVVKGESKADAHQCYPLTVPHDEDLGQSSGRPTPCTNSCFPQSGGKHHNINAALRREDAHVSHEKLRHRRLSIYSYGIMSQPQLTGLDSQLSLSVPPGGTGRSRAARPYMYNGRQRDHRDSYFPNGRISVDYWDGDESMSLCDHYVEVSHPGDGGTGGIIDFIPVSEAQKKAYDWVERSKIEGNRSPPSWIDRSSGGGGGGEPMNLEDDDDDSLASGSADINFLGKEELTTVFEQDSDSGYGEEYATGRSGGDAEAGRRETGDHFHDGHNEDEELACTQSPNSRPSDEFPNSRLAKGKSVISEIEELDQVDRIEQNGGALALAAAAEAQLSTRSVSDAGSYARESTDSEIVPARNSLRSLFYMDGDEVDAGQGRHELLEGRAYKPDNAYEPGDDMGDGDWTPEAADADHKDDSLGHHNGASAKRSPWKNITMSPSMRRKFLWPRSSPQPHIRRSGDAPAAAGGGMFGSGHHQNHHHHTPSFSDTDSQKARPRSPTSTNDNTSSTLNLATEGTEGEGGRGEGPPGPFGDEFTNGTASETVLSHAEVDECSPKSSPPKSSLSRSSSQQRASLSRSSSKSPQRTLSRNSSRRSRSSSWSSCLTDPAWSAQTVPSKKNGETGSFEKEGRFSSLIRLGKRLSRRSSPVNNSFNTSPWRSFSKASPQRGVNTR